jgi:NAD(P)-dependent dehydrogenase (short-subunit alcohol dehydrogenase family)
MNEPGSVVVVGATSEIGKRVARRYVDDGRSVVVTSRDAGRAAVLADELGGGSTGVAVDLTRPKEIAAALAGIGPVDRLIIVAVERDENSVRDYDIDGATNLVTMKMIGYLEVVHTLLERMGDDAAIVLFGGLAKDRPYPGSTTVTSVNGGVTAMVRTLAVEIAPIRVNAVHPAVVGDSPYWAGKPPEVLDALAARTPLGRLVTMDEIADSVVFLLENAAVNGINLRVDGGWMLT